MWNKSATKKAYQLKIPRYVVTSSVEAEWSATGDVGDSADENLLDAVFDVWQVHEFWESSIHCAGLSVFGLASLFDGLAAVANTSLDETSVEETDWRWV